MLKFLPLPSIVAWVHAVLWGFNFLLIHHDGLGLREAQAVTISCYCHRFPVPVFEHLIGWEDNQQCVQRATLSLIKGLCTQ